MNNDNLYHLAERGADLLSRGDDFAEANAVRALVKAHRELFGQLPEGMKHCTILFKECEHGHRWLTATNWVQHGCPTCTLQRVRNVALEEAAKHIETAGVWRGQASAMQQRNWDAIRIRELQTAQPSAAPAHQPNYPGIPRDNY